MDKTDKILLVTISVLLLVGLPTAWIIETHKPITETVILENQYLGNLSGCSAGDCVNCLMMDVFNNEYQTTYYFAGEHELRSDLKTGHETKVQWKYILLNGNYRIRNIYQETQKSEI